jgi:hypothetical protein
MNDEDSGRAFPQGAHSVCPRCGAAVGDGVWCEGCGLNLRQQTELPTADAYTGKVRERRWLAEREREDAKQRQAEAAREAAARQRRAEETEEAKRADTERRDEEKTQRQLEKQRRPWRRRPAAAVIALLALTVAGAVALAVSLDSTDPTREDTPNESADSAGQNESADGDRQSDASEEGDKSPATDSEEAVFFTDLSGESSSEPRDLLIFQQIPVSQLDWRAWGSPSAEATGAAERSDCNPDCATGAIVPSDITITLSEIRECEGRRQYSEAAYVLSVGEGEEDGTFKNPAC